MKAVDQHAIETVGISASALMETAGRAVAAAAVRMIGGAEGRRILVLAGKGNNGGDGLVAARVLHEAGACVRVLLSDSMIDDSGAASNNLQAARSLGIPMTLFETEVSRLSQDDYGDSDLCIDAVLGIGARGAPRGRAAELIQAASGLKSPILAVDTPSGLDVTTGQASGVCITAHRTITFGCAKVGLYSDPGIRYAGTVEVADIGFPRVSLQCAQPNARLLTAELVRCWLPERPPWANKGDLGPAIVVAGSAGMLGAAGLCSRATMRAGCGLTKLVVPHSALAMANGMTLEVICVPADNTPAGGLSQKAADTILEHAQKARVVAVGPGISTDSETAEMVASLLPRLKNPVVIDADALNILASRMAVLKQLQAPAVLTPHPGEMARLCGCSTQQVQASRLETAKQLSREYGVVVVLKGLATVIAEPGGAILLNSSGNSGLATAGAGDVLIGAITGLLAQGMSPFEAAGAGVYLHGLAADLWAGENGAAGMLAGDVLSRLPFARALVTEENVERGVRSDRREDR